MCIFNRISNMTNWALILALFFVCFSVTDVWGWSKDDKVRLTDVKTLTLYSGRYTTGRRSAPVPQVHCTGGSAGCKSFIPQVVQCSNKGSDGTDVQWECKADMENAYRFGQVDVICEGYEYPDDPYVLKGSCGLEYTLELTEEGKRKHGSQYSGSSYDYSESAYHNTKNHKTSFADLLFYVIVILFMYALYRTCVRRQQYSPTGDDYDNPDDGRRTGFGYPSGGPPPPGFRPGFAPGFTPDESCSSGASRSTSGGAPGMGGFWSGAAAGSMLGYMFGNRNTRRGSSSYFSPSSGTSWGGSGGFSSGTRTASGFGGTRRR